MRGMLLLLGIHCLRAHEFRGHRLRKREGTFHTEEAECGKGLKMERNPAFPRSEKRVPWSQNRCTEGVWTERNLEETGSSHQGRTPIFQETLYPEIILEFLQHGWDPWSSCRECLAETLWGGWIFWAFCSDKMQGTVRCFAVVTHEKGSGRERWLREKRSVVIVERRGLSWADKDHARQHDIHLCIVFKTSYWAPIMR